MVKLTRIALTLGAIVLAGGALARPAFATDRDDVMSPVHQWVDSLNKGDGARAIAACLPDATIVDEYPPFHWQGAGTCARWVKELAAYNASLGLTDGINTLRQPNRVDISGDHAYVVVPADFRYKLHGKPGAEMGALFTVSLVRLRVGWRIAGWAWSRPKD